MPPTELRTRPLLTIPLLIASWQLCGVALASAKIVSPDASLAQSITLNDSVRPHPAAFFAEEENKPARKDNELPGSTSANDLIENLSEDSKADASIRYDEDPSQFSVTDRAVTVAPPREILWALSLPAQVFHCLHEHVRERAPPV